MVDTYSYATETCGALSQSMVITRQYHVGALLVLKSELMKLPLSISPVRALTLAVSLLFIYPFDITRIYCLG